MRTSAHHKIFTILRRMYHYLSKLPGNLLTIINTSMFNLDITLFTLRYITTTTNFLDVGSATLNDEDELILIYYMRQFDICGNGETRKFDMYWESSIRAMET